MIHETCSTGPEIFQLVQVFIVVAREIEMNIFGPT